MERQLIGELHQMGDVSETQTHTHIAHIAHAKSEASLSPVFILMEPNWMCGG